ncbi:hypothetical protein [uncultured Bosea sp.]|uniref:hypothetical protein n=1 Tax=uncultured Bosea sp. TaxID=211457 RepID=UPI00263A5E59|nr:hypothetical protein [uncultured Bosea sp.]
MTAAELAATAFALCNAVRALAYLPQILRIIQDPDGARAISCATWSLFAISHLTTVAYALLAAHDWTMAAVFGVNALACATIIGLTLYKRRREQRRSGVEIVIGEAAGRSSTSRKGSQDGRLGQLAQPRPAATRF